MSEIAGRTVGELRAALQSGNLSVIDLLGATRTAIAASDADEPPLGAFLWVAGGELDDRAAELGRALAAGEASGPLAGIPVAVKDNICTLDGPTTCGSRILEAYRSPYEATAVRRLREAGALIVGKT
ncbi:MAG: Asp-tRNA(Asn)/Glu-tRNA(Gln) amidotransferase GatCAB subunit A, partial [Gemmatimonadetes bacterium]|nr:Asp-tRNA(Asn)/Glu-tRNA(Gln) amidotransferase GatCAB subunit A [Gemmatimonadota bacterium]NIS03436.1 Asp-tRNA(Asn)/Glu-tRNA(Gln) amidotransferase GatCAB subunit A [Gemmatimonadota bacterium]NIT69304.1 Asp-tRNA(Asn)/Glu-tRNA(Gln) amidotransferase GatCAB subunit A [Gemmatimonadota bacterium]NIU54631.1 Asp-tRNA(Asn)/Glu-tRNA(Gln) amidotransferase GatCAB subunit A [Gemmatimonadota bacterium]NIV25774.1 Asp-tRNA(Asn)/Glu-tRNA(Gln) amidotransferase GatCAB subunit A [Gemmatimonadota bacterium]